MNSEIGNQTAPQARRTHRRVFAWLALVFGAAVIMASLATVPALAEHNYSCEFCATINGPEENLNYNEGTNYTYSGICTTVWKNNGGGNYNTAGHICKTGVYTEGVCSSEGTVYGHGEVYNGFGGSHMAGHQDTRC
ncbi:MAG: hypothetical protein ACRDK2_07215 [Solirubrobacteraceae bacterium]